MQKQIAEADLWLRDVESTQRQVEYAYRMFREQILMLGQEGQYIMTRPEDTVEVMNFDLLEAMNSDELSSTEGNGFPIMVEDHTARQQEDSEEGERLNS